VRGSRSHISGWGKFFHKGMYKGRLRAVYKPMFLQKHPPLGQATRLPSSRERTTGARAPRPLSPASAPLHAQSTTKVDPVRYQSWRMDPSARGSKDRATAGWRGSSDGATADARESSNRRRGGGASRPAAPAKELTCRVLASQRDLATSLAPPLSWGRSPIRVPQPSRVQRSSLALRRGRRERRVGLLRPGRLELHCCVLHGFGLTEEMKMRKIRLTAHAIAEL
jgi:hypothetical protein